MSYRISNQDVLIYLRKSRKDIEEEQNAQQEGREYDVLDRHRNRLMEVAKKEQHNIKAIYEEVVSGEFISERPQIQKLIHEVEAGVADAVLVVDLDRLGRGDMLDQGLLDRAFRYSGTKIITPTEIYDPESDQWELVFGVKSLLARQELKAITRRMQSGRVSSAKEGKSVTKKPPFGYLRDENLKLYPDPDTSWAVKYMFEEIANGKGRQAVAQDLDKLGVKPPFSDLWGPTTITEIIRNEVYLGHIIWGKFKSVKQNGKYVRKKMPREKWEITENAHEPLVTKELFYAADQALKGRYRPPVQVSKTLNNPFAGILRCGLCGKALLHIPRKNRPDNNYRCPNPSCKGKQKGINFRPVEQKILEGLEEIASAFEIQDDMKQDTSDHQDIIALKEQALQNKEKEKEQLTQQKNKLHDLLEQGVYDIDTFMDRQKNLVERIDKIDQEINHFVEEIEVARQRENNKENLAPKIRNVLNVYQHLSTAEEKNRMLKSVLDRVSYVRKPDWKRIDQFELDFFPKT